MTPWSDQERTLNYATPARPRRDDRKWVGLMVGTLIGALLAGGVMLVVVLFVLRLLRDLVI
jgi:predicted lipid-binding transport protein (Tim44 family)